MGFSMTINIKRGLKPPPLVNQVPNNTNQPQGQSIF